MSRWRRYGVAGMSAAALVTAVPAGTAEAQMHCPTSMGRIACVDLTHQRMWVQNGRRVVFGPVPIVSGTARTPTRVGLWHVYWRDRHHFSHLYHVWMPYSQFFSGGEAFHSVPYPLSRDPGSYGCINMTPRDARILWNVLKLHDPVKIWGRKPGR
jgi:lipoprotein-anchoring transpeptidase ErfK/SrfK